MRINGVNNLIVEYNSANGSLETKKNLQKALYLQNRALSPLMAEHFLGNINFTGGYSISLRETVQKLLPEKFPPGVRELAIKTLGEGNPEDKTLIDIHKERYGVISDMETLDEVKEMFPELRGVVSDENITYNEKSLIGDIKRGELEYFDPDDDLTLQFIKMYWGEGFSLNDLTAYTGGKSVINVLRKLNIPRYSNTYGHVLKFSDKSYNERMTSMMSERQKEVAISRFEKNEGVRIPRGPLSDEHKRKISEGLIKYYAEHPEKLSEFSRNQKRYYQEHPEERERMTRVLNTAWNLREARSVRKALSKFMKKNLPDVIVLDKNGAIIAGVEPSKLKAFWDRNVWAKDQWSKCMKKGWEIVKNKETKEIESKIAKPEDGREMYRGNGIFEFEYYPKTLIDDFKTWHLLKGGNPSDIKTTNTFLSIKGDTSSLPEIDRFSEQRLVQYFKENPTIAKKFRMAQKYSLMKLAIDLWEMALETDCKKSNSKEKRKAEFMIELANYIDNATQFNNPDIELSDKELNSIMQKVVFDSCKEGHPLFARMLENTIEELYRASKTSDFQKRSMEILNISEDEVSSLKHRATSGLSPENEKPENEQIELEIYPFSLRRDLKNWGSKHGHDVSKIDSMLVSVSMEPPGIFERPEVKDLVVDYLQQGTEARANALADTYYIALAKTCGELSDMLNKKTIKISAKQRDVMTQVHDAVSVKIGSMLTGRTIQCSAEELLKHFIILSAYCYENNTSNIATMLLDNAEIAYRTLKNNGTKQAYNKLLVKPGYIGKMEA